LRDPLSSDYETKRSLVDFPDFFFFSLMPPWNVRQREGVPIFSTLPPLWLPLIGVPGAVTREVVLKAVLDFFPPSPQEVAFLCDPTRSFQSRHSISFFPEVLNVINVDAARGQP